MESKVELRHLSKDGKRCTRFAGNGVCTLEKNGLKYVGTQDGVEVEKMFDLDSIYRIYLALVKTLKFTKAHKYTTLLQKTNAVQLRGILLVVF